MSLAGGHLDSCLGQYVIQRFTLDAEALGQVGAVPDGEAIIRVPKKLMRHLKEAHGASEL
ncbi:MAG TPA: hypothetical protein VL359_05675 [bacterium]|nr:hypothetical protein [bacterium]